MIPDTSFDSYVYNMCSTNYPNYSMIVTLECHIYIYIYNNFHSMGILRTVANKINKG